MSSDIERSRADLIGVNDRDRAGHHSERRSAIRDLEFRIEDLAEFDSGTEPHAGQVPVVSDYSDPRSPIEPSTFLYAESISAFVPVTSIAPVLSTTIEYSPYVNSMDTASSVE